MRRKDCILLLLALLAGRASVGSTLEAAPASGNDAAINTAASSAASSTGKASEISACAKQCFETAQKLGFGRVAGDSMACFLNYKGKTLSTYDCCDKAEMLLGSQGPLANCMCCSEFAKAMLGSIPYAKLGTTAEQYLEKMHLCRVPLLGQSSCSASTPSTTGAQLSSSNMRTANNPSVSAAASTAADSPPLTPKPLIEAFNLSGLYPMVGFDSRFDPGLLAAQGQAAVNAGEVDQIKVVGASPLYNDYITGFVMWIERETPRYNTPKAPQLPPLPEQYKDDVMWVANLRRGPYPDLIKGRPQEYSPKNTDPLQNGQIANLPPGPAFVGRLVTPSAPPASSP